MIEAIIRLDSLDPEAASLFRTASASQRRNAVSKACALATNATGLADGDVGEALERLTKGAFEQPALRKRLERLAESLDEKYFSLGGAGDSTVGKAEFSRARAASALAFALSDDSDALHEALYEAVIACELAPTARAAIVAALRSVDEPGGSADGEGPYG